MLKKIARDFLMTQCPETVVRELEEDEKGYSPEIWKEMAELRWMGLMFPEKYGGSSEMERNTAAIRGLGLPRQ